MSPSLKRDPTPSQLALLASRLLCLLSLSLSACAPTVVGPLTWRAPSELPSLSALSVRELEQRYHERLSAWTRTGERFESFEGRLFVTATCLSPQLESVRATYEAERLSLTEEERAQRRSTLIERAEARLTFFVAIVTQEHIQNDLRPRGGALSAHLIINGQAIEPTSISELTLKEQLSYAFDFPYLTSLHRGYLVSFPKQERDQDRAQNKAQAFSLRISSVPGSLSLSWVLTGEPVEPRSSSLTPSLPPPRASSSSSSPSSISPLTSKSFTTL